MKYNHLENRDCLIHTIDGEFPALTSAIIPADENRHKQPLIRVKAKESQHSITVYATLAEGKFESEEMPTFYAC